MFCSHCGNDCGTAAACSSCNRKIVAYNINFFTGKNQYDFINLYREYIASIFAGPKNELTVKQLGEISALHDFAQKEVFKGNPNTVFTANDIERFKGA